MAVLKQEIYFQQYHGIKAELKNHIMKIVVIAILSDYDGENLSSKIRMHYPLTLHLKTDITSDFPVQVLNITNILQSLLCC